MKTIVIVVSEALKCWQKLTSMISKHNSQLY